MRIGMYQSGQFIEPIKIDAQKSQQLYNIVLRPVEAKEIITRSMEEVFDIMQNDKSWNALSVPERQAIWFYWKAIESKKLISSLHTKIGTTFPSEDFGNKCKEFSKEKIERTWNCGLICSHQNRNPQLSKWGGSNRLVFELIDILGAKRYITWLLAPSGLKEWEDLALGLGTYYYMGLITHDTKQVIDMLKIADKSVEGKSEYLPRGFSDNTISIHRYVYILFDTIHAIKLMV